MDPDPYLDTGKTCLGGGMHYPSASRKCFITISVLQKLIDGDSGTV